MPAKWKDILSDKNSYPDDFVVSVKIGGKDETLSLSEMRAYDTETRGALTADLTRREQGLQKREKDVEQASIGLATVIEKAAANAGLSVDEFIAGKAPTKKVVAAAADLDENDPLVGTLVKQMKTMQSRLDAQDTEIKKTRSDALGPMLTTYLEDYYEGKWEKLAPTLPKGSKVTREEALKYAQDNKLVDARGRLDLSKATRDLTYDARVKADAEAMAQEMRKKIEDERVLAAAPKPSGTHINVKPDKSLLNAKGRVKDFDEVLGDAMNDSDLWKGITQTQ
jgi:hypothetical protein